MTKAQKRCCKVFEYKVPLEKCYTLGSKWFWNKQTKKQPQTPWICWHGEN